MAPATISEIAPFWPLVPEPPNNPPPLARTIHSRYLVPSIHTLNDQNRPQGNSRFRLRDMFLTIAPAAGPALLEARLCIHPPLHTCRAAWASPIITWIAIGRLLMESQVFSMRHTEQER